MFRTFLASTLLLAYLPAHADDIRIQTTASSQSDLQRVARDMSAAFGYKPLNPAEALGLLGFRIDALASYTETENPGAWRSITGDRFNELTLLGVAVGKGFPFGLDFGAFAADVVDTNASLFGAEVRYAFAEGGIIAPALGLRAGYTKLTGADDLEFSTRSLDVSISKGFTLLTPYVGAGRVWGKLDPEAGIALNEEEANENKLFAGVRISLALLKIVLEADNTGDNTSYNLRVGFGL